MERIDAVERTDSVYHRFMYKYCSDSRFCCFFFGTSAIVLVLADVFQSMRLLTFLALYVSIILVCVLVYAIIATNIRTIMIGVAAFALCLSIWIGHWPLKATFAFSKPQLTKLATRIENGEEFSTPRWIGCYRVLKIEQKSYGAICFWTNLYPSGHTGIIKCAEDDLSFNISTHIQLDDDSWHLIVED